MIPIRQRYNAARHQVSLTLIVLLVFTHSVCSQTAPLDSYTILKRIDSGHRSAISRDKAKAGNQFEVVYSTIASAPGATWMRVHFERAELSGSRLAGNASFLRLTSLVDGGVQYLNAISLREWRYKSAYFNGNQVRVELLAAPGTGNNRIVIGELIAGFQQVRNKSLCGTDDRVLSNDPRAGRILPAGCTGFLIGQGRGCFLTAGHCPALGFIDIVEFNVPLSDSGGGIIFAAPQDQYPIDFDSIQFDFDEPTILTPTHTDWSYFGTFPNSNTGLTAFQAQGGGYILALSMPPANGFGLRKTGYGTDTTPNEHNQVQQVDQGTYDVLNGTLVSYDDLDTQPGDSGAPVEHLDTGEIIAIHTTGNCSGATSANHGTAITHAGLQNALANPIGICASPIIDEAISRSFTLCVVSQTITQAISRPFTLCNISAAGNFAISRAITVELNTCPADSSDDGLVNVTDLLALLAAWGLCPQPCLEDVNLDRQVNVTDLLALLAAWGVCS